MQGQYNIKQMKLTIPFLFLSLFLNAQQSCVQLTADEAEQNQLTALVQNFKEMKMEVEGVLKIPLVIHVVSANISPEQIASGVDVLNEAYNVQHGTEFTGANPHIEFYLANISPSGEPTNGVNFYDIEESDIAQASIDEYLANGLEGVTSMGISPSVLANEYAWPVNSYLNTYIVTEFDGNNGGSGVQAVAFYPTSSIVDGSYTMSNAFGDKDIGYYDTNHDGQVAGVGTYEGDAQMKLKSNTNTNKTLIHEKGHCFNTPHPFGSNCTYDADGVKIGDTPPTMQNSSCSVSCSGAAEHLHMDYFSQQCRTAFTPDQAEYMRLVSTTFRAEMLEGFNDVHEWKPTEIEVEFEMPETSCSAVQDYEITVTNTGGNTLEHLKIMYGSRETEADTIDIAICLLPNQYKTITLPSIPQAMSKVGIDVLEVNKLPYEFDRMFSQTTIGNNEILIELSPDLLGGQLGWEITQNGELIAAREAYPNFEQGEVFTDQVCVTGGCIQFTLTDVVGNGIPDGWAKVWLNGTLYAEMPDTFMDTWTLSNCAEIVGIYSILGEKLDKEPSQGWYVIHYADGTRQQFIKQ